jgi:hypothetical protein
VSVLEIILFIYLGYVIGRNSQDDEDSKDDENYEDYGSDD